MVDCVNEFLYNLNHINRSSKIEWWEDLVYINIFKLFQCCYVFPSWYFFYSLQPSSFRLLHGKSILRLSYVLCLWNRNFYKKTVLYTNFQISVFEVLKKNIKHNIEGLAIHINFECINIPVVCMILKIRQATFEMKIISVEYFKRM